MTAVRLNVVGSIGSENVNVNDPSLIFNVKFVSIGGVLSSTNVVTGKDSLIGTTSAELLDTSSMKPASTVRNTFG